MSQNSFVCTQLNSFKYNKWLNSSIWPIDRTLTGTTTLCQSELGSNGNKCTPHFPKPQDWSLTIKWFSVIFRRFVCLRNKTPNRDAVCIFHSPANWVVILLRFKKKKKSCNPIINNVRRTLILQLSYLPNPSARAGYDTRSIFKRSLTGLNSEFSFS